jgi:hypothetical protein
MPAWWSLPICLSDLPAIVAFATNNQHVFVFVFDHVSKGRMALYEYARIDGYVQFAAKFGHTLRLTLSTAVGKENEGDSLRLEICKGLVSARKRIRAPQEHSINTNSRQY